MKRVCLILYATISVWSPSIMAVDTGAVVGGAVGGGVGAAVGSEVGGRGGAIVGSAVGAAVGTAVLAEDDKPAEHVKPVRAGAPAYHAPSSYQHIPPGHAKHWHKHKHKYR